MTAFKAIAVTICSYLLGSIPFGLIASRTFFSKDIRKMGSGNIGATNMLRNFGLVAFVVVLLLDALKGAVAIWVARALGLNQPYVLLAGVACIAGHDWSLYLKFKGGKGISTSAGVILAAFPWPVAVAVIGAFLLVAVATRFMSAASLSGAVALPVATLIHFRADLAGAWAYIACAGIIMAMALVRHAENIRRLWTGEEPHIKFRKPGMSRSAP